MSFQLPPSKRPYNRNPLEPNGKGKLQKTAGLDPQHQPLKRSLSSAVFRILCPTSKSGILIRKDGTVDSQICQETGAKVVVEEVIPGCNERVIVIKGAEISNEQNRKNGGEDNNVAEGYDDTKEQNENNEDKEAASMEDSQYEKVASSVQKALLLVFERLVEKEPENDGGGKEIEKSSSVVVRLLVLSRQVGCVLGKGGRVIKQMSAESRAQIRILPRDKLPLCASSSDEVVQLTGNLDAVRKALQSVSQQLLKNPPRERDPLPASKPIGPSSLPSGLPLVKTEVYPPQYGSGPHDDADYHTTALPSIPKFHENVIPSRTKSSQDVLTFRLLCYNEKIGGLIGKGGTIIETLKHETGCSIRILEGIPDTEDRIIVVSGPAHPDDRISAPQDAVLRVNSRILRSVLDSKEKIVLSRLLISSNQIGCLLGKGGAIMAEMRKLSGAQIQISGKDQISKCVSENEAVVQITGEFETVQEALLQITTRLQHHHFRDTFPSINHPAHPAYSDLEPPFASYMGRRGLSPPGMYSNLGPLFQNFDVIGDLPPHGGIHLHDDRSSFMHNIHRLGVAPHSFERTPSSGPWGSQGLNDDVGSLGFSDYAGGIPQRRIRGFGGGSESQPAFITNTTMEVVVPRSLLPSIYGENGGCLKQIRQISGAKITITEPRPSATEAIIIISGIPEQTQAAQDLLQAFVMSGIGSP